MEENTDSDKYSSLLRHWNNYDRKNIYNTGFGVCFVSMFASYLN